MCSTNPTYIQAAAFNDVLGSEIMSWASAVDDESLKIMLENSLCIGLYKLQAGSTTLGNSKLPLVHVLRFSR